MSTQIVKCQKMLFFADFFVISVEQPGSAECGMTSTNGHEDSLGSLAHAGAPHCKLLAINIRPSFFDYVFSGGKPIIERIISSFAPCLPPVSPVKLGLSIGSSEVKR